MNKFFFFFLSLRWFQGLAGFSSSFCNVLAGLKPKNLALLDMFLKQKYKFLMNFSKTTLKSLFLCIFEFFPTENQVEFLKIAHS